MHIHSPAPPPLLLRAARPERYSTARTALRIGPFGGRTTVERALQMVGMGVELLGAEPVDQFDNSGVPYGDSCEPHPTLLHESKCHPAGSAAQIEVTRR